MRRPRGASLLELLAATAILAAAAAAVSVVSRRQVARARSPAAAARLVSEVRLRRSQAVASAATLGLVFTRRGDSWLVSLHVDGDGDGIRSEDIRRAVDRRIEGPQDFRIRYGEATPGFHPDIAELSSPPPSSSPLPDLSDPIRFGRTDIVSFGPRGQVSPGTFYLTDGRERQFAVVLYGATGRVRTWEREIARGAWRRR